MNNSSVPDKITKKSATSRFSALVFLSWSLLIIATIGFSFSLLTAIGNAYDFDIINRPICFSKGCAADFIEQFMPSFVIAKGTLDFLVGIATTGGIIVALLSYITASGTAALTNHISHFSIFQNYISNEVAKRTRINPSSVDTLVWYNQIFSYSRSGRTDIAGDYIKFVEDLNSLIATSNTQAERARDGAFRYKKHQERMREHLKKVGIEIFFSPRNDFFEMEGQVLSLIERVNQSFCYSALVPRLLIRNYI